MVCTVGAGRKSVDDGAGEDGNERVRYRLRSSCVISPIYCDL
jgi:hypothetical protein